ncbi:hypothetical protein [Rickettsiales endosymbiont of Stachyamoeba lipophora]|uniref:hypothetical protein n=1 Tax=Rickettsiales endosymbiont of Stachyamoeba lipophora TaxID=2486578 RepID=UPI000F6475A6|nr:hypothetical protein [Rickettsiales endosymbiont of Stachyamoeba lipophora]AZL16247.1 hypothetical protein EF513_06870 [Rickettsiales endosymbiont of Stachyamoeba lipophora]
MIIFNGKNNIFYNFNLPKQLTQEELKQTYVIEELRTYIKIYAHLFNKASALVDKLNEFTYKHNIHKVTDIYSLNTQEKLEFIKIVEPLSKFYTLYNQSLAITTPYDMLSFTKNCVCLNFEEYCLISPKDMIISKLDSALAHQVIRGSYGFDEHAEACVIAKQDNTITIYYTDPLYSLEINGYDSVGYWQQEYSTKAKQHFEELAAELNSELPGYQTNIVEFDIIPIQHNIGGLCLIFAVSNAKIIEEQLENPGRNYINFINILKI